MFDSSNYFSLFQLPVILPVDTVKLSAHYQQLQRQFHPDNYATASDSEKAAIMQKSATINTGYRTLKDPVKAAEYRVSMQGIDIDTEHDTIRDLEFLSEQFELRERLDDIESTQDWALLDAFYAEVIARKKAIYDNLLHAITQTDWQNAKTLVYKLRYFARLIEHIELLQEKQFDL